MVVKLLELMMCSLVVCMWVVIVEVVMSVVVYSFRNRVFMVMVMLGCMCL